MVELCTDPINGRVDYHRKSAATKALSLVRSTYESNGPEQVDPSYTARSLATRVSVTTIPVLRTHWAAAKLGR